MIDPQNPIVQLCSEGMIHQTNNEIELARERFWMAWEQSATDYERCISAHYVAIHQTTPEDNLKWNLTSLENADKIEGDSLQGFYPSLYLCVGKSHEDLGNVEEAKEFYRKAAEKADCLTDGPYADIINGGIREALHRLS